MAVSIDYSGRTVLVTGGTKGVGRGIAQRFVDASADVFVCGRNQPDDAVGTFLTADVRDPDSVGELVAGVVERTGRLDVVVNNAGGAPPADAATASARYTQGIIDLNLTSVIHVSQAAHGVMSRQGERGAIVNISSLSGTRPSPNSAAYGAAKAGVVAFTNSVAVEWADVLRANTVVVGMVETELSDLFYGGDEGLARVAATVPLGRLAQPTDVGDACLFLGSPLADYVTGATLEVHGGDQWPAFWSAAQGD